MTVDRDDAQQALEEIGRTQDRVGRVHSYADMAPFLIIWGAIWAFANLVTEIRPAWSNAAWLAGLVVGVPLTTFLGIVQSRRRAARLQQAGADAKSFGMRSALSMAAILLFLASVLAVTGPVDARQANAAISLFWAFVYMGVGAWIGMRLVLIGAVTAVVILFAYFALDQHYYLVMGAAAGGSLILGGLWLRKI
jgi:hypothetical protein